MRFKRAFLVFSLLLIIGVSVLWAGDSASFVDLGFSPDGTIYMFAQYGVQSGVLKPWADLFVVDVERNEFVPKGRISYTHDRAIEAGQDGSGVLYHLISKNAGIVEEYEVVYHSQGQPLYIALDGDPAYDGKTINFRDFTSGTFYRANLIENVTGSGEQTKSAFFITVESVDSDGEVRHFTIGNPDIERNSVFSYRIKKVLVAPSGNSLIFVIEMKRHGENGPDIRYMVEALRF